MRILLDESLPHDLDALILDHQVSTVRQEGWASVTNGKLLALAPTKFDAFITADRNLEFQQNLAKLPVAVVVLVARKNRVQDLAPLLVWLSASPYTSAKQVRPSCLGSRMSVAEAGTLGIRGKSEVQKWVRLDKFKIENPIFAGSTRHF
jgi:hypothetical protein